jgi:hypothetical protein
MIKTLRKLRVASIHCIGLFDEQPDAQWRIIQRFHLLRLWRSTSCFRRDPCSSASPTELNIASGSLRAFVGAMAEISDANARDLSQLCDEFKFIELAKTVGDWQADHPVIRCELDLAPAASEERLESQARTILMLDSALHRWRRLQ